MCCHTMQTVFFCYLVSISVTRKVKHLQLGTSCQNLSLGELSTCLEKCVVHILDLLISSVHFLEVSNVGCFVFH